MKLFKFFKIFIPLIVICIFVIVAIWFQKTEQTGNRADSPDPEDELQAALTAASGADEDGEKDDNEAANSEIPEPLQNIEDIEDTEEAVSGMDSAGENIDLPLHDLYAASGQTVRFHIYHPDAMNYVWEYYDEELMKWLPVAENLAGWERDALGRMTAYADFETSNQPDLMIRCLYDTENTGEQVSEIAFLKVLSKEIRQIELADSSMEAEAGSWLDVCDLIVKVTYADDTSEVIDSLYGLYFMDSEVESEESSDIISADGILTERKVQTTINHFCPYHLVSAGKESITLAYISDTGSPRRQLSGTVTGTDVEPPVISMVDVLVSTPDTEETLLTMLVTAEDNVTPYSKLQYAVFDKEIDIEAIEEEAWHDSPKVTMTLQGDGIWFLYCRDQAGNISVYKQEDISGDLPILSERQEEPPDGEKDTQAPVIRNIYVEAN